MAKVEPPSTPRDGSSDDPQALDTELSLTADTLPSGTPDAHAPSSGSASNASLSGDGTPDSLGLDQTTLDLGQDLAEAAQDHIAYLHANQEISVLVALDARDSAELPIDDAAFMADARFVRDGSDLLLIKPDGTAVLIENYFAAEIRPDVIGPNGQLLTPQLVESFLEPIAPGQVASSDAAQVAQAQGAPIGTVDSLTGEVWAVRPDGTRVLLQAGDPLFQGDVIETGGEGSVKMSFVDNTLFSLDTDARLALDEMVYDPASGSGESAFSILKGGFLFVSGQIAQTNPNDMTVTTPVATIGIRGTGVTGNVTLDGGTFTILNGAISISIPGQAPVILETTFESVTTEPGDNGQLIVQQFQETAQAVITRNAAVFRNLSDSDIEKLERAIKAEVAEENAGVEVDDVSLDIQEIVDSVPLIETDADTGEDAQDGEDVGDDADEETAGEDDAGEEASEEGEDGADAGEEILDEELVEDIESEEEEVVEEEVVEAEAEAEAEADDSGEEVNEEELAAVENNDETVEQQSSDTPEAETNESDAEETDVTNVTDGSSDTNVEGASGSDETNQEASNDDAAPEDEGTASETAAINVTEDTSSSASTTTSTIDSSTDTGDTGFSSSIITESNSTDDTDDNNDIVVAQEEDNSPVTVNYSSFSSSGVYSGASATRDTTVDASTAQTAVNITTGSGSDTVSGGVGNDTISSGAGNDSVTAGDGDDTVELGAGNDTAVAGSGRGNDDYDGGADTDLIMYDSVTGSLTANLTVTLNGGSETSTVTDGTASVIDDDTFINFENVRLGDGDDTITVNALDVNVDGDVGSGDKIDLSNISTDTTFSFSTGLASSGGASASFTNMEVVEFGAGDDTLSLTSLDQSSDGADGSNVLDASRLNTGVTATVTSGDITLSDGTSTATHENYGSLTATESSDTISLGIGSAAVDGGAGNDTVALTYNFGSVEQIDGGSEGGEFVPTGQTSGLGGITLGQGNTTSSTVTFGTDLKNVETLDLTNLTLAESTTDISVAAADVLASTANRTLTILGSATENAAKVIVDDGWSSGGTDPGSGLGIFTHTNGAVLHLDTNALSDVSPVYTFTPNDGTFDLDDANNWTNAFTGSGSLPEGNDATLLTTSSDVLVLDNESELVLGNLSGDGNIKLDLGYLVVEGTASLSGTVQILGEGDLTVEGNGSIGALDLDEGFVVYDGTLTVGALDNSDGTGPGPGLDGNGTLIHTGTSTLDAGLQIDARFENAAGATLTIADGALLQGSDELANSGVIDVTAAGTLTLSAIDNAGTLDFSNGSVTKLRGDGLATSAGGTIDFGDNAGTITLDDFVLNANGGSIAGSNTVLDFNDEAVFAVSDGVTFTYTDAMPDFDFSGANGAVIVDGTLGTGLFLNQSTLNIAGGIVSANIQNSGSTAVVDVGTSATVVESILDVSEGSLEFGSSSVLDVNTGGTIAISDDTNFVNATNADYDIGQNGAILVQAGDTLTIDTVPGTITFSDSSAQAIFNGLGTILAGQDVKMELGGGTITGSGSIVNDGTYTIADEILDVDFTNNNEFAVEGSISTITINQDFTQAGTMDLGSGVLVTGTGSLVNTGIIDNTGGTNTIDKVDLDLTAGQVLNTSQSNKLIFTNNTIAVGGTTDLGTDGTISVGGGATISVGASETVTIFGQTVTTGEVSETEGLLIELTDEGALAGSGTLINNGSIPITNGGAIGASLTVENNGLFDVESGSFQIDTGTFNNDDGTLHLASGTTLDVQAADGTLELGGTFEIISATVTGASNATLALTTTDGSVGVMDSQICLATVESITVDARNGSLTTNVGSEFAFVNGATLIIDDANDISGSGGFTFGAASALQLENGLTFDINGSNPPVSFADSAVIQGPGTVAITSNGTLPGVVLGTDTALENTAELTIIGEGFSLGGGGFSNTGKIILDPNVTADLTNGTTTIGGEIEFTTNNRLTGDTDDLLISTGTIDLSSGTASTTHTIEVDTSLTSAGTLQLDNATLTLNSGLTNSGSTSIGSAAITGTGQVTSEGPITISTELSLDSVDLDIRTGTLDLGGDLVATGGATLEVGASTTIGGEGTLDLSGGAGVSVTTGEIFTLGQVDVSSGVGEPTITSWAFSPVSAAGSNPASLAYSTSFDQFVLFTQEENEGSLGDPFSVTFDSGSLSVSSQDTLDAHSVSGASVQALDAVALENGVVQMFYSVNSGTLGLEAYTDIGVHNGVFEQVTSFSSNIIDVEAAAVSDGGYVLAIATDADGYGQTNFFTRYIDAGGNTSTFSNAQSLAPTQVAISSFTNDSATSNSFDHIISFIDDSDRLLLYFGDNQSNFTNIRTISSGSGSDLGADSAVAVLNNEVAVVAFVDDGVPKVRGFSRSSGDAFSETVIDTTHTATSADIDIVALSDGGFAVAWVVTVSEQNDTDIVLQRFDSSGTKQGDLFFVTTSGNGSTSLGGNQSNVSLAVDENDVVAVAFNSSTASGPLVSHVSWEAGTVPEPTMFLGSGSVLDGGALVNENRVDADGGTIAAGATLVNQETVSVSSGGLHVNGTLINDDSMSLDSYGLVEMGSDGLLRNTSTLEITDSGTLTGGSVVNTGMIDLQSGTLSIQDTSFNTTGGTIDIGTNTLQIEGVNGSASVVVDSTSDIAGTGEILVMNDGALSLDSGGTIEVINQDLRLLGGDIDGQGTVIITQTLQATGGNIGGSVAVINNGTLNVEDFTSLTVDTAGTNDLLELNINGTFTNNGLITANNGRQLDLHTANFSQGTAGVIQLIGNEYDSSLYVYEDLTIAGTIELTRASGADTDGRIYTEDGATLTIAGTLVTNDPSGTVDSDHDLNGFFVNQGTLILNEDLELDATPATQDIQGSVTIDVPGTNSILDTRQGHITIATSKELDVEGTLVIGSNTVLDGGTITFKDNAISESALRIETGDRYTYNEEVTFSFEAPAEADTFTPQIAGGGAFTVATGATLDVGSSEITIATFDNNGILEVSGETFILNTAGFDNADGTLELTSGTVGAQALMVVSQDAALGGRLVLDTAGEESEIDTGQSNTLTITGTLVSADTGSLGVEHNLIGNFVNQGRIQVDSDLDQDNVGYPGLLDSRAGEIYVANGADLEIEGTLIVGSLTSLSGGGSIEMEADSVSPSELKVEGGDSFTYDGSLAINFVPDSTLSPLISGDGAFTLGAGTTLDIGGADITIATFTNLGSLRVENTTLGILSDGFDTSSGTILLDSDDSATPAALEFGQDTSLAGSVIMDGSNAGYSVVDSGSNTLTLTGTIQATDTSESAGTHQLNGTIDNNGLIDLDASTSTSTSSVLDAQGGSVDIASDAIFEIGGEIDVGGSTTITGDGSFSVSGVLDVADGETFTLSTGSGSSGSSGPDGGTAVQVDTVTSGSTGGPQVVSLSNGSIVTLYSHGLGGSRFKVTDSAGGEVRADGATDSGTDLENPAISATDGSGFVVLGTYDDDGDIKQGVALFDNTGTNSGTPSIVEIADHGSYGIQTQAVTSYSVNSFAVVTIDSSDSLIIDTFDSSGTSTNNYSVFANSSNINNSFNYDTLEIVETDSGVLAVLTVDQSGRAEVTFFFQDNSDVSEVGRVEAGSPLPQNIEGSASFVPLSDGGFAIAWTENSGGSGAVYVQTFDVDYAYDAGEPQDNVITADSGVVTVATGLSDNGASEPDLTVLSDGSILVTYIDASDTLMGQHYTSSLTQNGSAFAIGGAGLTGVDDAQVTSLDNGEFAVAADVGSDIFQSTGSTSGGSTPTLDLEISGGTVTGGGTLVVADSLKFDSGVIANDAFVINDGTVEIDGTDNDVFGTLQNDGTIVVGDNAILDSGAIDGSLTAGGNSLGLLDNNATLTVGADATLALTELDNSDGLISLSSAGAFSIVSGLYKASGGTIDFSSGTMQVSDDGTLQVIGSSSLSDSGTLSIGSTGTFAVASGETFALNETGTASIFDFTGGGVIGGPGTLDISGTVTDLSGATIGTAGLVNINNALEVGSEGLTVEGALNNAGTLTVKGGALTIDSPSLVNTNGVIELTSVDSSNESTLTLEQDLTLGGQLLLDTDSDGHATIDTGTNTLTISGTIQALDSNLESEESAFNHQISGTFDNNGLIDIDKTVTMTTTSVLDMQQGTLDVAAEMALTSNGQIIVGGSSTFTGDGTVTVQDEIKVADGETFTFEAGSSSDGSATQLDEGVSFGLERPQAATLSDGNYVSVYSSDFNDYAYYEVRDPFGTVIKENTRIGAAEEFDNAELAALSNGGFVVAGLYTEEVNSNDLDRVAFQIFDNNGDAIGSLTNAKQFAEGEGTVANLTTLALDNGGFMIAYVEDPEGSELSNELRLSFYNSSGTETVADFKPNFTIAPDGQIMDAVVLDDGSIALAVDDGSNGIEVLILGEDGTQYGIFNSANSLPGSGAVGSASIEALSNGGFVLTWTNSSTVLARAFDVTVNTSNSSATVTAEGAGNTTISTSSASNDASPTVTKLSTGELLFAYNTAGLTVTGEFYDEALTSQGSSFNIASNVNSVTEFEVTPLADGRYASVLAQSTDAWAAESTGTSSAGPDFRITSGTMSGAGTFSNADTIDFDSSTLASEAFLENTGSLNLIGINNEIFGTLQNNGTMSLGGSGILDSGFLDGLNLSGTTNSLGFVDNDGLFNLADDARLIITTLDNTGGEIALETGAFVRVGSGSYTAGDGTIDVSTGTLQFSDDATLTVTGDSTFVGSGEIRMSTQGTLAVTSSETFTFADGGTGEMFDFANGGVIDGPGTLEITGTATNLHGATIESGAYLDIDGRPQVYSESGASLTIKSANIDTTDGTLYIFSDAVNKLTNIDVDVATLTNAGVFRTEVSGGSVVVNDATTGGDAVLNNTGTLLTGGGSESSNIFTEFDIAIDNTNGVVDASGYTKINVSLDSRDGTIDVGTGNDRLDIATGATLTLGSDTDLATSGTIYFEDGATISIPTGETFSYDAGDASFEFGGTVHLVGDGTFQNNTTLDLDGFFNIDVATFDNDGDLDFTGSVSADTTFDNDGTVSVKAAGATLEGDGFDNTSGVFEVKDAGLLTISSTLTTLTNDVTLGDGSEITGTGTLVLDGDVEVTAGTAEISSLTVDLSDTTVDTDDFERTLFIDGNATALVGSATVLDDGLELEIGSLSTLSVVGGESFTYAGFDAGTVAVLNLNHESSISGDGTFVLTGDLDFRGTIDVDTFDNDGTLEATAWGNPRSDRVLFIGADTTFDNDGTLYVSSRGSASQELLTIATNDFDNTNGTIILNQEVDNTTRLNFTGDTFSNAGVIELRSNQGAVSLDDASAGGTATFVNEASGAIIVSDNGSYGDGEGGIIDGAFINLGAIEIDGALKIRDSFNTADGTITIGTDDGGRLEIENGGTLVLGDYATIADGTNGTIRMEGGADLVIGTDATTGQAETFTYQSGGPDFEFDGNDITWSGAGTFVNQGSLALSDEVTLDLAGFVNAGTFGLGGEIGSNALVQNASDAVLEIGSGGLVLSGSIDNQGTIDVEDGGDITLATGGATTLGGVVNLGVGNNITGGAQETLVLTGQLNNNEGGSVNTISADLEIGTSGVLNVGGSEGTDGTLQIDGFLVNNGTIIVDPPGPVQEGGDEELEEAAEPDFGVLRVTNNFTNDGLLQIDNMGTLVVDDGNGTFINLGDVQGFDPGNDSAGVIQAGLFQNQGLLTLPGNGGNDAAILTFENLVFDNTEGTIEVGLGAELLFDGAILQVDSTNSTLTNEGGTITFEGAGSGLQLNEDGMAFRNDADVDLTFGSGSKIEVASGSAEFINEQDMTVDGVTIATGVTFSHDSENERTDTLSLNSGSTLTVDGVLNVSEIETLMASGGSFVGTGSITNATDLAIDSGESITIGESLSYTGAVALSSSSDLDVDGNYQGSLDVTDGGAVNVSGAGTVTASAATVGEGDTLGVQVGSFIQTGEFDIGTNGKINVDGSTYTFGSGAVFSDDSGTLVINGGSSLAVGSGISFTYDDDNAPELQIGNGSTGYIVGDGTFQNTGAIVLDDGDVSISIASFDNDGSIHVSGKDLALTNTGFNNDGGTLNFADDTSLLMTTDISLGGKVEFQAENEGGSLVTVDTDGNTLTLSGTLTTDNAVGNSSANQLVGTIVNTGLMDINSDVDVTTNSVLDVSGGTLTIDNDTLDVAGTLIAGGANTFQGDGDLNISGVLQLTAGETTTLSEGGTNLTNTEVRTSTPNTTLVGTQSDQDVTKLSDGGYVITWHNSFSDEVKFRVYNSNGFAITNETGLSASITDPMVTAHSSGYFVISGHDNSTGQYIHTSYRNDGTLEDGPWTAASNLGSNSIIAYAGAESAQAGDIIDILLTTSGVRVRRRAVTNLGGQHVGDSGSELLGSNPGTFLDAAITANGEFVVLHDVSTGGFELTVFDSNGGKLFTTDANSSSLPASVSNAAGIAALTGDKIAATFVVGTDVFVQVFTIDSSGSVVTADFNAVQVNTDAGDAQPSPDIDVLSDGTILVTWLDATNGASARVVSADGTNLSDVFDPNLSSQGTELFAPVVAALDNNNFVTAYQTSGTALKSNLETATLSGTSADSATLTVDGGTITGSGAVLDLQEDATFSNATLDTGVVVNTSGSLEIGATQTLTLNDSTLTVADGGHLAGSSNTVTTSFTGDGEVSIESGGSVDLTGVSIFGRQDWTLAGEGTLGAGELRLDDISSADPHFTIANGGTLTYGTDDQADVSEIVFLSQNTLTIEGGGVLQAGIGEDGPTNITISGNNSPLIDNDGVLDIQGQFRMDSSVILDTSDGTLQISDYDAGSTTVTGELLLRESTKLVVSGSTDLGHDSNATAGQITLDGGTVEIDDQGGALTLTSNDPYLSITEGTLQGDGTLVVESGVEVQGTDAVIAGSLSITNNGLFNVEGDSSSNFDIGGAAFTNAGTLDFDIGNSTISATGFQNTGTILVGDSDSTADLNFSVDAVNDGLIQLDGVAGRSDIADSSSGTITITNNGTIDFSGGDPNGSTQFSQISANIVMGTTGLIQTDGFGRVSSTLDMTVGTLNVVEIDGLDARFTVRSANGNLIVGTETEWIGDGEVKIANNASLTVNSGQDFVYENTDPLLRLRQESTAATANQSTTAGIYGEGTFTNQGSLDLGVNNKIAVATLRNEGTIQANDSDALTSGDGTISLNTGANLVNTSSGTLEAEVITGDGTVVQQSGATIVGTPLSFSAGADLVNQSGSTLDGASLSFAGGSSLENQSGATITNSSVTVTDNGSSLVNQGSISSGTLTFSSGGDLVNQSGAVLDGSVLNFSGTKTALENLAGGTIDAASVIFDSNATMNNAGVLNLDNDSLTVSDATTVTNTASGVVNINIQRPAETEFSIGLTDGGVFENAGTINIDTDGTTSVTVILDAEAGADMGGAFVNSGTINIGADDVLEVASSTLSLQTGSKIQGGGKLDLLSDAVLDVIDIELTLDGVDFDFDTSKYSTIQGSGTVINTGALSSIDTVTVSSSRFVNQTHLAATGATFAALFVNEEDSEGAETTLTLNANNTISGTLQNDSLIEITSSKTVSGSGTLINTGTLVHTADGEDNDTADLSALTFQNTATGKLKLQMSNGDDAGSIFKVSSFTNEGLISFAGEANSGAGSLELDGGSGTLTNAGTITLADTRNETDLLGIHELNGNYVADATGGTLVVADYTTQSAATIGSFKITGNMTLNENSYTIIESADTIFGIGANLDVRGTAHLGGVLEFRVHENFSTDFQQGDYTFFEATNVTQNFHRLLFTEWSEDVAADNATEFDGIDEGNIVVPEFDSSEGTFTLRKTATGTDDNNNTFALQDSSDNTFFTGNGGESVVFALGGNDVITQQTNGTIAYADAGAGGHDTLAVSSADFGQDQAWRFNNFEVLDLSAAFGVSLTDDFVFGAAEDTNTLLAGLTEGPTGAAIENALVIVGANIDNGGLTLSTADGWTNTGAVSTFDIGSGDRGYALYSGSNGANAWVEQSVEIDEGVA